MSPINFVARLWKDGQQGGTPITAAALNRLEDAVSALVAGVNGLVDTVLTKTAADQAYAPLWQANSAVTAGAPRTLPDGTVGVSKTDRTTGASFDTTEASNWTNPTLTTATGRAVAFSIALGG